MGDKGLRLNDLHTTRLLVPEVTEHVDRSLQQLRGLLCPILLHQQLDDEHSRFLHGDIDIIRKVKLAKQQLQRVLLGGVKRSGRCQERIVHMLQVLQGKQAQLPKLTALSLIDEVSRHKRLATEGAAVVSLQWEGTFRNQMSAGQPGTSEASLFAEDIGNEGDEMVGQALARRHVPSLDERCPVKVHAHHVVDALSNI